MPHRPGNRSLMILPSHRRCPCRSDAESEASKTRHGSTEMNNTKQAAIAAAVAGLCMLSQAQADEAVHTMKPLQAVAFEIGSERIVGYYLSENDRCTLRVTRATESDTDAPHTFEATTFETVVDAGKATRYVSTAGNAFEFACADGAVAMNVTQIERVASSS